MKPLKMHNSKGELITLNAHEKHHVNYVAKQLSDRYSNGLAYDIIITSLTTVSKSISEQKFFETAPADYLPVKVGEGMFSDQLVVYRSFDLADAYETGVINTGSQSSRLASADAGVDSVNIKIFQWAKSIGWSIIDLEQAAKSGNWDLIAAKERSRKKNWDLGIQKIAFLGADGQNGTGGACLGLLNQPGITNNAAVITQSISSMSPAQLKVFTAQIVEAYRANNNRTAYPTHFIIPESDFNGLASPASSDFPIRSTLDLLEETFKVTCKNKNFKILPLAYADAAYHTQIPSIAGNQVYVLLNYDEESLVMNIPLDYTNTLANSINNFQFQNVAYGQFSGVLPMRPLELMYFTY